MGTILIVAYSTDQISRIISLMKKLEGKLVIVALTKDVEKKLKDENIPYKASKDYLTDETLENIVNDSLRWLQTWPSMKIGNTSFKEILTYGNTSLWWFARSTYLYENYKTVATYIETINSIIEAEKPDKIIVPDTTMPVDDENLPGKITVILGELKNIPVSYTKPNLALYVRHFFRSFIKPALRSFSRMRMRFIKSYYFRKYYPKPSFKERRGARKRVLVLCHVGGIQEMIDPMTGKRIKDNVMVADVVRGLEKSTDYDVVVAQDYFGRLLPKMELRYIPFDNYIDAKVWIKTVQEALLLVKKWHKLKYNESFRRSLTYKGVPIWELMRYKFSNLFHIDLVNAVLTTETVRHMIDVEKPDAIVITYETGYYGKAAIIEGKLRNVPTLGLQHGIIHPYHPDYIYGKEEVSTDDTISPLYCPFPDKLAVFGEYAKRVLTEYSAYPPNKIVITGQPRYDILRETDRLFSKENFCERLNLDSEKKTVLLATQDFPDFKVREIFLRCTLRALRNFPEVQIIIKPHPGEDEEWHRNIVMEEKVDATVMSRNSNTLETLYICDLLMTVSSTTAIEAVILNKPVVIVNLTGEPDPIPYVKSGVALGVYREGDLTQTIKDALYNERVHQKLRKARERFVYEHAFEVDGRSAERVVNLIEELIIKHSDIC